MADSTMTYGEARQIIRKHYDMWQAAQKLHEVLEKASQAESFLSSVEGDIRAKEARLVELDGQVKAQLIEANEKLAKLALDYQTKSDQLELAHKDKVMSLNSLENDYRASLAQVKDDLARAQADRDSQMAKMLDEIQAVMAKRDNLQAELDSVKAKFADLVK